MSGGLAQLRLARTKSLIASTHHYVRYFFLKAGRPSQVAQGCLPISKLLQQGTFICH
jgi:hypothetical protein